MNKLKKNYSYYSFREKPSKLIYSNYSLINNRKKNDDIYQYKKDFINRHENNSYITIEEQEKNDNSFNEEKNELNDLDIEKRRNYNNPNFEYKIKNQNKFINLKGGDIQLFKKFKNHQTPIKNANTKIQKIINSKKNKQNMEYKFNNTNQIINHFNLSNTKIDKNLNLNSYINNNKPIRLNYNNNYNYDEISQRICNKLSNINKNENDINQYDNIESIQNNIDDLKHNFNFIGNNDEFIKYLKIIKMKAELTNLVEILFNNGKNIDERNAEKYFYKIDNMVEYKNNEEKNLLNGYQYLIEKLVEINNLNSNNFNN